MTKEERVLAAKEQIQRYLYSYYPQWRLIEILSIKKILENKYEFYSGIIDKYKQPDDNTGEATITQEITNGLLFNAVSECLQYIEDLFLLIKFSQNVDFFIKNVVTYKAGEITNFVKTFKIDSELACKYFHIPLVPESEWPNGTVKSVYKSGLECLTNKVTAILEYFNENKFFYNQYKHGLTIALRPFALFDDKSIKEKKDKPTSATLFAWDNLGIKKIMKSKDRFNGEIMFPLSPKVQPHLAALQQEDNLLRLVTNKEGKTSINDIVNCALNVRSVLVVLIQNFASTLADGKKEVWLPKEEKWITLEFNKVI